MLLIAYIVLTAFLIDGFQCREFGMLLRVNGAVTSIELLLILIIQNLEFVIEM